MTKYTINITHPDWNRLVLDKSELGLGEPFQRTQNQNNIYISEDIIRVKRSQFLAERAAWDGTSPDGASQLSAELMITGGDSPRARRRRLFRRRLYRLLFPANTDTNAAIDLYWGESNKIGDLDLYENKAHIYRVLDNYVLLIDYILGLRAGLSWFDPTDTDDGSTEEIRVPTTSITKQVPLNFISITSVEIPLLSNINTVLNSLVQNKTSNFFDPARELKTFINFGSHNQYVLSAWRRTSSPTIIQVKTATPVNDVNLYDQLFLSRDIASSVVDTIEIDGPPAVDTTLSLRPPNFNIKTSATNGTAVTATLSTLNLLSGSLGESDGQNISYNDTVFNRWYTADFNVSELNIDFTNYNNFVFYGSSAARLDAFVNKVRYIESKITTVPVSSSTDAVRVNSIEIENVKRNFDPYEQFLYFSLDTAPYSASLNQDEFVEYNPLATWPKQPNGMIYSTTSSQAINWYATQRAIALRFDEANQNFIVRHLPRHLQEDNNSAEFLKLVSMVGHVMDNIKIYIDQFPTIYDTSPDPLAGLSMDQVYEVASSFGLTLPNAYKLESLNSFIQSNLPDSTRVSLAETWKRVLHNAILLYKTKGTRAGTGAVLNLYGINSPLIQLKESAYPSRQNYVQSDEVAYGLKMSGNQPQFVLIPFVSNSINTETLQIRFRPTEIQGSSILTGDLAWGVHLDTYEFNTSNKTGQLINFPNSMYEIFQSKQRYGRIYITSGTLGTRVASSSYFPLFSDDFTTIMLRRTGMDMTVAQSDGEQILFLETIATNLNAVWNTTKNVALGGSGSMKLPVKFNGIVDEVRCWSEYIDDATFERHVYDPAAAFGTTYTSSFNNLLVDLTFSQPLPSITSSATNETPNLVRNTFTLPAIGFTTSSYSKFIRQTKQYVPMVGAVSYADNKVVVAPPFVPQSSTVELSRTNSVTPVKEKQYVGGQDQITFAISPLDYVNQNIRRTMGVVDVNYLIGSPRKIARNRYPELDTLYRFYIEKYAGGISPNAYTRFMKNAVSAPTEQIESMVPARAKFLQGVLIESLPLYRQKENLMKRVAVDGTNTYANSVFASASSAGTSASAYIGAYDFTANYKLYPDSIYSGQLDFLDSALAKVNTTLSGSYEDYTSHIKFIPPVVQDTGYPRYIYSGQAGVVDSEINTIIPFYDIPPAADFLDIGTRIYFNKESGVYKLPSFISRYEKEFYKVKFAVKQASALDQLYSPLSLFPPDTIDRVGRDTAVLSSISLMAGGSVTIPLRLARVFLLFGIIGSAGLNITLLRDTTVVFNATLGNSSDTFPYVPIQSAESGILNCTIQNTTDTLIQTSLTFNFFVLQGLQTSPSGYLPRHYKFFRNTSIAQRRRNIDGCKIIFCPEGCPEGVVPTDTENPIRDDASAPTNFVLAPSLREEQLNAIQFGGRGPLVG